MAFLASLKKDIAKFKKEEIKDPIYVPYAEYVNKANNNQNDDAKQQNPVNNANNANNATTPTDVNNPVTVSTIKEVSIACISDIHMRLKELKMVPADILVLSGDFTCKGTLDEAKIVNKWLGEMKMKYKYKYIILTLGNHEGYGNILIDDNLLSINGGLTTCISDPNKINEYKKQEVIRKQKHKYLHENIMKNVTHLLYQQSVIIEGIKFYGSPWTPNLLDIRDRSNPKHSNSGFMGNVEAMNLIWKQIPIDVDYLITHGPPQGILDINGKGCSMLRLQLSKLNNLKVHQFGHVHSGYGYKFITKKSLKDSIKHIDINQQFKDIVIPDNTMPDDIGFPIKLDLDVRRGKTLKKFSTKKLKKYVANNNDFDIMKDVVLFVNAACDGFEQPIHFKLPVLCNNT